MSSLPHIKLDNFEGPFDVLIELARKRQLDLSNISLLNIADAYFTYVQTTPIPVSLQADFAVVASTLLLLKLRQLLPQLLPNEETEVQELSDRLRIYQLYRAQADWLNKQWNMQPLASGPGREALLTELPLPELTTTSLEVVMQQCVDAARPPLPKTRHLRSRGRSLQECVQLLKNRLQQLQRLVFQKEFHGMARTTTAVSFLAVLELARQQLVTLAQAQPFGDLTVTQSHDRRTT